MKNQSDGFVDNIFLQRDDTNNIDEQAAKASLAVDLSDNTALTLRYQWFDIDNGYDAFALDNDNQTRSDEPGFDRQETHAIGASITHLADFGEVEFSLTTIDNDIDYAYDEDWTFVGFHPFEYSSFDRYARELDTQTAEIRIVGNDQYTLFNDSTTWGCWGVC